MNVLSKMNKNGKGSLLIGVLIIMLMLSIIAISVMNRTMYGSQMSINSKDSFNAYQDSDTNVESVLENLKKLDTEDNGKIPENTEVSEMCPEGTKCYGLNVDEGVLSPDVTSDKIYFIQKSGIKNATGRAVVAPIPDRVTNHANNLWVDTSASSPGTCTAVLRYRCSVVNSGELEIRKSGDSSELDSGNWKKAVSPDPGTFSCSDGTAEKTVTLKGENFTSGATYHFAIKVKSADSFFLDSRYVLNSGPSFTPTAGCSGS